MLIFTFINDIKCQYALQCAKCRCNELKVNECRRERQWDTSQECRIIREAPGHEKKEQGRDKTERERECGALLSCDVHRHHDNYAERGGPRVCVYVRGTRFEISNGMLLYKY